MVMSKFLSRKKPKTHQDGERERQAGSRKKNIQKSEQDTWEKLIEIWNRKQIKIKKVKTTIIIIINEDRQQQQQQKHTQTSRDGFIDTYRRKKSVKKKPDEFFLKKKKILVSNVKHNKQTNKQTKKKC